MILGFKQKFPDGSDTNFREKILASVAPSEFIPKIHSIRAGRRWRPGMSIQMAYGVRTKHYQQFNAEHPELQVAKNVQRIFMSSDGWIIECTVDNRYLMPAEIDTLIKYDGLTRRQFIDWFFPDGVNEFSGQIIHWTDFKY